jgi:hypothetical protein
MGFLVQKVYCVFPDIVFVVVGSSWHSVHADGQQEFEFLVRKYLHTFDKDRINEACVFIYWIF